MLFTKKNAKEFIATLRRMHPTTVPFEKDMVKEGDICVGGIINQNVNFCNIPLTGLSQEDRFPDEVVLGDSLYKLNDSLDIDHAEEIANNIIVANDASEFEEACNYVEAALTYPEVIDRSTNLTIDASPMMK